MKLYTVFCNIKISVYIFHNLFLYSYISHGLISRTFFLVAAHCYFGDIKTEPYVKRNLILALKFLICVTIITFSYFQF